MGIQAERDFSRAQVARIVAGQPVYAWDDPKVDNDDGARPTDGLLSAESEASESRVPHRHHHKPSFYDREALEEKLHGIEADKLSLSQKEVAFRERLAKAEATLLAMRAKKRDLSTAKLLDDGCKIGVSSSSMSRREPSCLFRGRRAWETGEDGKGARAERQEELANFAAKDRIMELELLNVQLNKGQAKVESEARLQEAASRTTKAELERVRQRLQAMPKRFTESLERLRDEVEELEKEKLSLELAKQQRGFKEADNLAATKRQHKYLTAELDSLLDEIDDVEHDRNQWKRRLRVETTRFEASQSQRDKALRELRTRFGEDAVERAAFASAACREESTQDYKVTEGAGAVGGDSSGGVPLSVVAEALRPAYAPDGVVLTTEAVMGVARECGIDVHRGNREDSSCVVGLGEFSVMAKLLRQPRVTENDGEIGCVDDLQSQPQDMR